MNQEDGESSLALAKPGEMMRLATDVAGVCAKIVKNTAVNIKGKQYVKVEGWQSIATAHGCVAGARDVERIEGGIRAIGEIRRGDNGTVIATAEGFVGDDEKTWSSRDEYAKRAMAQTRAISRACRSAFAHVVVLIDKDLSTTPAEEVPYGGFPDEHNHGTAGTRKATTTPEKAARVNHFHNTPTDETKTWRDTEIHFGKNQGVALRELNERQLEWYANDWVDKKILDSREPSPKDRELVDALLMYRRERDSEKVKREEEKAKIEESWTYDEIQMGDAS